LLVRNTSVLSMVPPGAVRNLYQKLNVLVLEPPNGMFIPVDVSKNTQLLTTVGAFEFNK
jgi:hypothetical protein